MMSAVKRLKNSAYREFDHILDYVWKTPRFIEAEWELEQKKLDAYFPADSTDEITLDLRRYRWADESRKLAVVFPFMMANGNLFGSISVYETFCLSLCKELENHCGVLLSNIKGNGISRLHSHLRRCGIDVNRANHFPEVDVALCIRNCLFHASGLLRFSREEVKLRQIASRQLFFPKGRRDAPHMIGKRNVRYVFVANSGFGDILQIENDYSFIATAYLRDHFISMCDHATQLRRP